MVFALSHISVPISGPISPKPSAYIYDGGKEPPPNSKLLTNMAMNSLQIRPPGQGTQVFSRGSKMGEHWGRVGCIPSLTPQAVFTSESRQLVFKAQSWHRLHQDEFTSEIYIKLWESTEDVLVAFPPLLHRQSSHPKAGKWFLRPSHCVGHIKPNIRLRFTSKYGDSARRFSNQHDVCFTRKWFHKNGQTITVTSHVHAHT